MGQTRTFTFSKGSDQLSSFDERPSFLHTPKSSTSGLRAQIASVLKLSTKRKTDLGITYWNFAEVKARELKQEKVAELVKAKAEESLRQRTLTDMELQCERIISSLIRATHGPTAMIYADQRSTKRPFREPSAFPYNPNFSQQIIPDFQGEEGTGDNDSHVSKAYRTPGKPQRGVSCSAGHSTPLSVMPEFPCKLKFSQEVLHDFQREEGTEDNDFRVSKAYRTPKNPRRGVSCSAGHSTALSVMPEFPCPLSLEIENGLKLLHTPQAGAASKMVSSTPSSTLLTPGICFSVSTTASSSYVRPNLDNRMRMEIPRRKSLSHMVQGGFSGDVIGLGLPADIPSPVESRRGPGAEVLASLVLLEKICAGDLMCEEPEEGI